MPYSLYTCNKLIDHAHGKTSFTMPSVWVGLSTTTPNSSDGNVTEPSGNNYSRVSTSGSTWTTAASRAATNATDITFPTSSGSWGTITHIVAYDASSGGNLLWYASITPKSVPSGATPKIVAGEADVTLS